MVWRFIAGIKHKKAANDAKRGKVWSKIARMIIVAAKAGGGDPGQNLTLRYAIDKGKAANMPKDTIEKAIKKGTGELEGVNYESVTYEGYAPGGIAVLVEVPESCPQVLPCGGDAVAIELPLLPGVAALAVAISGRLASAV